MDAGTARAELGRAARTLEVPARGDGPAATAAREALFALDLAVGELADVGVRPTPLIEGPDGAVATTLDHAGELLRGLATAAADQEADRRAAYARAALHVIEARAALDG